MHPLDHWVVTVLAFYNDPLYGNEVWPFIIEDGKIKSVTVTDFVEFSPYEFVKMK